MTEDCKKMKRIKKILTMIQNLDETLFNFRGVACFNFPGKIIVIFFSKTSATGKPLNVLNSVLYFVYKQFAQINFLPCSWLTDKMIETKINGIIFF